jgi:dCTP deaminase
MSILSDISIAELCGVDLEGNIKELMRDHITVSQKYIDLKERLDVIESHIENPMIFPFVPRSVNKDDKGNKIISYGLSSYGYDLRCGNKFKVFSNINACVVDPKGLDEKSFVDVEVEDGEYVIIPPNSFALTYSMEEITVPRDITGIVLSKSTYARTGLICLATPLEAGWKGFVTLEFSNTTPLPMKLYAGEGCCQVLWFKGDRNCLVSYADRDGKYQNQKAEVTLPRI